MGQAMKMKRIILKIIDDMRPRGWWAVGANNIWNHGDFRDGALYYVQDVFRQIVEQGRMK